MRGKAPLRTGADADARESELRMGVYDRLFVPRPSPCPSCGSQEELVLQFHLGDVYLNKFRIGDTITWSDRSKGTRRSGLFETVGYAEFCGACGWDEDGLYLVRFDGDTIIGYREATERDMETLEW